MHRKNKIKNFYPPNIHNIRFKAISLRFKRTSIHLWVFIYLSRLYALRMT
nr:MAG TPA: hypothetical protein [Caudoviricetes sp.]